MKNNYSAHVDNRSKMTYGIIRKNLNFPMIGMHRRIELVLVTDGELVMHINGRMRTVLPGHAVFLDSFDAHAFYTYTQSTCAIIEFFPEFCHEIYAPFYHWLSNHKVTDNVIKIPDEIFNCVVYLLPKTTEEKEYYDDIPSHFFAILAPLFHAIMTQSRHVAEKKSPSNTFEHAAEYVIENYDKELSRERVAREIGVRPESLSRTFSKRAQLSFTEYVQYVRLNISLRKIQSGESICAAAYSSGFDSIRTYNRIFKKFYGKAPSEYLRSIRWHV